MTTQDKTRAWLVEGVVSANLETHEHPVSQHIDNIQTRHREARHVCACMVTIGPKLGGHEIIVASSRGHFTSL